MDAVELNLDKKTRKKITELVQKIPETAKTEKFFIIKENTLLNAEKGDRIYQHLNSKKELTL